MAFSVQMTASCGPSAAGSLDARTFALNSPFPTRSVSPLAFTASRCAPRITQETSCPASASRTAKWLPTAPAPKTQIRMGGNPAGREGRLLVFTSLGRAQPARRTGRVADGRGLGGVGNFAVQSTFIRVPSSSRHSDNGTCDHDGTCHVKDHTGNCRDCLRNGAVRGGLCHRERRRWSWRRSRWRLVAAAVIMAVAIAVVASWRWTPFRRPASWRRPFSRQGGAFPFVLRTSFILGTPFVLRATHEFRGRRPGAELARTRPQLSPHRSAASSRHAGQRDRGRGARRMAIRTVQRRRLVAARQWRIRLGRAAVLAVRLFRHLRLCAVGTACRRPVLVLRL